ncbi:hypothetical protein C2G38_2180442 [Gigaspora rosea]|uniref:Regulator of chromosome condensation 1/beta-lactamase-inhibitor protein II n=1 Tax=Gigaspora rosea TaxID=44941 RepID=A0A397VDS3_9GLOM|nr:hypothetical protein C2G38_2180442 [Gigaspora rosea]
MLLKRKLEDDAEEIKYPTQVVVDDDLHIVKISCGSLHTAALTKDEKVITWGCNDEGFGSDPSVAKPKGLFTPLDEA